MLLNNGEIKTGLLLVAELAKDGHVDSQRGLGIAYLTGEFGLKINYEDAVFWFEQAAKKNDPISLYNLGCMFYNGIGLEKNELKAFDYFLKSADFGYVDAQRVVGDRYYYGDIVELNHNLAKKYYLPASKQGDKHSNYKLGVLKMFEKDEKEVSYNASIDYFEKSITNENKHSLNVLIGLLKQSKSKPTNRECWTLKDLLLKLSSEHNDNYYYRGQTKFYEPPLRPSMYRFENSIYPIKYNGDKRLRKTGTEFYFEKAFSKVLSNSYKIKRIMSMYITNALGYTFTQAMFQQAGYTSEGLDVTSDLLIALFFSTYEYKNGGFKPYEGNKESVIYRWKYLKKPDPKESLQKNYYECGNLIPTYEIYKSFNTCNTVSEFYESLREYANVINWGPSFDLDNTMGNRPFSLIKLPHSLLKKSRVIKQKASLLLGDCVISEQMRENLILRGGDPPPVYMEHLPFKMVQDLSEEGFCETFIYERNNKLALELLNEFNIHPKEIYDEDLDNNGKNDDLSQMLLYGWIENLYAPLTRYGVSVNTNSPAPDYEISYTEMLSYLNEWQEIKKKNGYHLEFD
nr:FRG domain-containing protein [Heliobacterium chlorum]